MDLRKLTLWDKALNRVRNGRQSSGESSGVGVVKPDLDAINGS